MSVLLMIPGLRPDQIERLAVLSEELGEAQQAVGKILRHGFDSMHPASFDGPTNLQTLEKELGDVLFAMRWMWSRELSYSRTHEHSRKKAEAIVQYLHHATVPKDLCG